MFCKLSLLLCFILMELIVARKLGQLFFSAVEYMDFKVDSLFFKIFFYNMKNL